MQFTKENAEKVMAGTKTQTRRLAQANDWLLFDFAPDGSIKSNSVSRAGRIKWQTGKIYAVCPGRGKPSIGRVKLLAIRKEKLQDIWLKHMNDGERCWDDLFAEGIPQFAEWDGQGDIPTPLSLFIELWDSINSKGKRWADNPDVWALTFEVVP